MESIFFILTDTGYNVEDAEVYVWITVVNIIIVIIIKCCI